MTTLIPKLILGISRRILTSTAVRSAAWAHNMLAMLCFNVTTNGSDGSTPFSYMDSHIGKRFDLGVSNMDLTVERKWSGQQTH